MSLCINGEYIHIDELMDSCLDKQRVREAITKCCEEYSEFDNKCLKIDLIKELGI